MSDILKTVDKTAKGLQQAAVIDKNTMRKFDTLCFIVKFNKEGSEKVEAG